MTRPTDPRCARCDGPSHTLPPEAAFARPVDEADEMPMASHWCRACMREAWPASVVDDDYALVWKAVNVEIQNESDSASESLAQLGLTRDGLWHRGLAGAPYRLGFPGALLGGGNFLLSPLGALKEHSKRPLPFLPQDETPAVMAIVVPWRRLILDPRQVLIAGAFTPYLPVEAHSVVELSKQGLTPERAAKLLDNLPESWSLVESWETKLHAQLPENWASRIGAAEHLAAGLSLMSQLPVESNAAGQDVRLKIDYWARTLDLNSDNGETVAQRSRRLSRFLGTLIGELFRDPSRERRYQRAREVYGFLVRGERLPLQYRRFPLTFPLMSFLYRDPVRVALDLSETEGHRDWHWVNPWLELESLLDCLLNADVDLWIRALDRAARAAGLAPG